MQSIHHILVSPVFLICMCMYMSVCPTVFLFFFLNEMLLKGAKGKKKDYHLWGREEIKGGGADPCCSEQVGSKASLDPDCSGDRAVSTSVGAASRLCPGVRAARGPAGALLITSSDPAGPLYR